MAFDYKQLLTPQAIVGVLLFLITSWLLGRALLGKKASALNSFAFGLAAGLLVPGAILLLLDLVLHVTISTPVVYLVFVLVCVLSWAKTDGKFSKYGLPA